MFDASTVENVIGTLAVVAVLLLFLISCHLGRWLIMSYEGTCGTCKEETGTFYSLQLLVGAVGPSCS